MTQLIQLLARRRRRWLFRGILIVASVVVGVLVTEVMLMAVGFSNPQIYVPDEDCGTRLMPGFQGRWSREGASEFRINQRGFRDQDWPLEKPRGTVRIAVLGDSYVEAFQVNREHTFSVQLQHELNSRKPDGTPDTEVLSFGVSGWGTGQELMALRKHVLAFDPDIVLLLFLPANDLRDNFRPFDPQACRPFFELVDDELRFDASFRNHPLFVYGRLPSTQMKARLINASRVLQLIQQIRQTRNQSQPGRRELEQGLDALPFQAPPDDAWQDAWKLTERLIETMHAEVVEARKQFVVATVTSGFQVHPQIEFRRSRAKEMGIDDLLYADRRLMALGERHGFQVIPLAEPLGDWAEKNNAYLHGFKNTMLGEGHWNENGHREAARVVATGLRRLPSILVR